MSGGEVAASGTERPGSERFDLVIAGGRLFDPVSGTFRSADIGVADGIIVAVEDHLEPERADKHADVEGAIVTSGLIDVHVHAYHGATFWGMDVDQVSLASGVTTIVDAGSAGPYNFEGLARILRNSRLWAKAYLNIAAGGLVTPYGELLTPGAADVEAAVRIARAYPELIIGFKLRASPNTVGEHAAEALAAVRRAADETGLKVMVHVSQAPPDLSTVLDHMRAGDVLTHCFTPYDNCVVGTDGRPRAEVVAALERGVLIDVGHGSGSFSFPAAEAWARSGERAPIVSTDVHRRSVLGPVFDMQTVMTKMLVAGFSLEDVLRSVTVWPGALLEELASPGAPGPLKVGMPADIAALEVEERSLKVWDSRGVGRVATERLTCRLSVRAGEVLYAASGQRVIGV